MSVGGLFSKADWNVSVEVTPTDEPDEPTEDPESCSSSRGHIWAKLLICIFMASSQTPQHT